MARNPNRQGDVPHAIQSLQIRELTMGIGDVNCPGPWPHLMRREGGPLRLVQQGGKAQLLSIDFVRGKHDE